MSYWQTDTNITPFNFFPSHPCSPFKKFRLSIVFLICWSYIQQSPYLIFCDSRNLPTIMSWVETQRPGVDGVNIITSDFVELTDFANVVIKLNNLLLSEPDHKPRWYMWTNVCKFFHPCWIKVFTGFLGIRFLKHSVKLVLLIMYHITSVAHK